MGQMIRPRHFATLRRRVETKSAGGVVVESWQDLPPVAATFEPMRESEQQQNGTERATLTARIRIRYRTDVSTAMRVVVRGVVYDVHSAFDEDGRGRWLVMEVSTVEGE
jgi:SPP1 family predicted phage head-tail adaptor